MKILLVHQNFPGQFKHLVHALISNAEHQVTAFTMTQTPNLPKLRLVRYKPVKVTGRDVHPWVAETETKVIRGDAAFRAARSLLAEGYIPDVIIAHPGWGESLFLKEVWPTSKLIIYCEFHYAAHGTDVGFDPEFPRRDPGEACRVRMKNVNNLLHFEIADAGVSPTAWQRDTFPEPFRSKIEVIHDGIDTQLIAPNPNVTINVKGFELNRSHQVITFVNRNLEPYRGYHTFMRALPEIQANYPNAHIVIVGADGVSYGAKPPDGKTWKEIFLSEVAAHLNPRQVHFVGHVSHEHFIALMQVSSVHVYLTYPFVLSWSLLEAMACSCSIVASDTAPVREAIKHEESGILVDFFDHTGLARQVGRLLDDPALRKQLGDKARREAVMSYDLRTTCLPKMLGLIERVAGASQT